MEKWFLSPLHLSFANIFETKYTIKTYNSTEWTTVKRVLLYWAWSDYGAHNKENLNETSNNVILFRVVMYWAFH